MNMLDMISILVFFAQFIIVFGIFNVWFVRINKKTHYRGSNSSSLKEEFLMYGYPVWFFYVIGGLKILFSMFILIGFWLKQLIFFGSLGMSFLMIGAIFSHFKVKDSLKKFVPAGIMLFSSLFLLFVSVNQFYK